MPDISGGVWAVLYVRWLYHSNSVITVGLHLASWCWCEHTATSVLFMHALFVFFEQFCECLPSVLTIILTTYGDSEARVCCMHPNLASPCVGTILCFSCCFNTLENFLTRSFCCCCRNATSPPSTNSRRQRLRYWAALSAQPAADAPSDHHDPAHEHAVAGPGLQLQHQHRPEDRAQGGCDG
jgi:hypothetical protein